MRDMLSAGSAWLNGKLATAAAHNVTYKRGVNSLTLAATIGQSIFLSQNEFQSVISSESRDFFIAAAALTFGDPERGDIIVDTLNGVASQFEVMSPGGETHFRFSDSERKTFRIHSKYIGIAV